MIVAHTDALQIPEYALNFKTVVGDAPRKLYIRLATIIGSGKTASTFHLHTVNDKFEVATLNINHTGTIVRPAVFSVCNGCTVVCDRR